MKRYDISQEVFGCSVYPGDPTPQKTTVCSMDKGDMYNLSAFSMCAHNGTHIDAPRHFIKDGKTVDELPLSSTVGDAFVAEHQGELWAEDARNVLVKAGGIPRILLKGELTVTAEAAEVFAAAKICLLGNESQTVGPEEAPMQVHKILLGADVVLLEGIRLQSVREGKYLLFAAPLNLAGTEGAPCRAVLLEDEK